MNSKQLRDLEILTALMEQGGWKSLRVTSDAISVNLSQSPDEPRQHGGRPADISAAAPPPAETAAAPAAESPPDMAIDPSWVAVEASNLGTFYRSPKPGSPPFVEVGQTVRQGAELCLIEVMKLFTSVRAEIGGKIRHIAAADGQLVEGGQPLMYIEIE